MRTIAFGFASLALILVACGSSSGTGEPGETSGTSDAGAGSSSTKSDGGSTGTGQSGANGDSGSGAGDDDSDASPTSGDDDSGSQMSGDDASSTNDAGRATDAGKTDASTGDGGSDGTGTRQACTGTFGSGLTGAFGRLDGYIVSVVTPKGSSTCNADSTHVHVQVSMNGDIYDVAINVDGGFWLQKDIPLPEGAWSEGWHGSDGLDYVKTLGLSSSDFATASQSVLTTDVENALASANHISAYGTTYTGSDKGSGIHDIHRQATNEDGAIFLDPTEASPHALLFRFSSDSF